MYHNFILKISSTNKKFFRLNPTSILIEGVKRNTFKTLDGCNKLGFQDATEVYGEFRWDNVPFHKEQFFDNILDLQNKTGELKLNKMQMLAVKKNLLHSTQIDVDVDDVYWDESYELTLGTPTISFDGITLANLYTVYAAAGGKPIIQPVTYTDTFEDHNVFSCHVKRFTTDQVAIRMFAVNSSTEFLSVFNFVGGGSNIELSRADSNIFDYTIERKPNGWFRISMYVNGYNKNVIGQLLRVGIYVDYAWTVSKSNGTYVDGPQLEQGVDCPTWFLRTYGEPLNRPLNIHTYSVQIENTGLPGFVKKSIVLPFKLTGDWY